MARKQTTPTNIRLATPAEIAYAKGEILSTKAHEIGSAVSQGTRTTFSVLGAFGAGLFGIKPKAAEENEGMVWVVADGKVMQVPSTAVCSA